MDIMTCCSAACYQVQKCGLTYGVQEALSDRRIAAGKSVGDGWILLPETAAP